MNTIFNQYFVKINKQSQRKFFDSQICDHLGGMHGKLSLMFNAAQFKFATKTCLICAFQ